MNPEELNKRIEELTLEISELRNSFEAHTHSGIGSSALYNDPVNIKPGQGVSSGSFGMVDGKHPAIDIQYGFFILGTDDISTDGLSNAQLTIQHSRYTDGSTNQTFFYGFRGLTFIGTDGVVASGGTSLTADSLRKFEKNSLAGHFVSIRESSTATSEYGFIIASNNEGIVQLNGSLAITSGHAIYTIFVPMYLGGATFPWRRIYTTGTSSGGIRFGLGSTGGGADGLLYMDEDDGRLKFRRPNGSIDTV